MDDHAPLVGAPVDEIVDVLAAVDLFASVDRDALRQLAGSSRLVAARAGEIVLRRGDPGDAFFIVASGLLEVLDEDNGRVRLLRAGTPFGELALLSGASRTATVRAVRDSELWRLPQSAFSTLLERDAPFAHHMVRALTQLIFESRPATQPDAARVFAVLPLHSDASVSAVVDGFALSGERVRVCRGRDAGEPARWAGMVESLERTDGLVVLVASAARDDWFRFCEREADRVIAVADAGAAFEPLAADMHPDLVLFGRAAAGTVGHALRALAPRAHHLVDARNPSDGIARMLRRVMGRSVGVVLSGGGARGAAHIGVLRSLEDAGVVVDRIGGTSMGALVGALTASGMSPGSLRATLRRELVERKPFTDYAIPRVALIRAGRARSMLERLFGRTVIEVLDRDFFCVSADLVSAETVVHRRGSLVGAVGASMSLPGVAPPIRDGNRLLVDGGVLDNLPIEIMTSTNEGPVIAVDVLARGLPGARRSSRSGRVSQLPTIVETLARSSTLASRSRADQQRALATLAIIPELRDIGLLEFGRFDAIVEAGRRAADVALADAPRALFSG